MRRFGIIVTLIIATTTELVRSDGFNPISAPLANEIVPAEKPYTIRWSPGTPGPVDIRLHFAETQPIYLTESTENDGSYEWTPSGVFDGKNNYFLSICDLSILNECTYTYNGRFAISSDSATSSSPSSSSSSILSSSTDSTQFPTPSSSSTLAPSSPNPSASNDANPPASNSGLSLKAKIAIAVVFAVFGTALLGLGLFCLYRRRQRRQNSLHAVPLPETQKAELHGDSQAIPELVGDSPRPWVGGQEGGVYTPRH